MESIDQRKHLLNKWLEDECKLGAMTIQQIKGDASFRRYFRIYSHDGSYIAMDAPPGRENCRQFVIIAKALRDCGLKAPEIIRADLTQGFLLITDFGDLTFLSLLNDQNANELYHHALIALSRLQACSEPKESPLPIFDEAFMWQEWSWHKDWFLTQLLNQPKEKIATLETSYAFIVQAIAEQPKVFMHRDYHSANLMVLPNREVGILDFQDAFIGPLTYDLVSLLRDCYVVWPNEYVLEWATKYLFLLTQKNTCTYIDEKTFMRWFDLMSVQRHLKALMTFARKHIRDGQSQYLNYIPTTLQYLSDTAVKYRELSPLYDYLQQAIIPTFQQVSAISCAQ